MTPEQRIRAQAICSGIDGIFPSPALALLRELLDGPTYAVGDPDPNARRSRALCFAEDPESHALCTLTIGHGGPLHAGGDNVRIIAVWEVGT